MSGGDEKNPEDSRGQSGRHSVGVNGALFLPELEGSSPGTQFPFLASCQLTGKFRLHRGRQLNLIAVPRKNNP